MESRWIWPFELLDKLGEGGMGLVYRARYVRNDRQVAVKLLPADAAANKTLVARFDREMEVLKQLDHPNIVHCFGGTTDGEQHFYAMELVEGGTLADLIRQKGQLSLDVALDYGIQMADALGYAHDRGVIHRDIKPSNFLLTKQGQIKLSDFGLVTVVAGRRLTASGRTMGTVEYMSPEQIRGKPGVTQRSDLYALGCVIYEMLAGRPPYLGESTVEIMHKHLKEPIPHLVRAVPDCPLDLDQLICELIAKTPELRPDSAQVVSQRLQDILQPSRRFKPFASTIAPVGTAALGVTSPVVKKPKSAALSSPSLAPMESVSWTSWILLTCLLILCGIGWMGWRSSSKQLFTAEQSMVRQLDALDVPTRVLALSALDRFDWLHPTTIDRLNAVTKTGPEPVAVGALTVLAHHARESRGLQMEIYKLQQNGTVGSNVRSQAGITVEALKRAQSGSIIISVVYWTVVIGVSAAAIFCVWLLRDHVRSIVGSIRILANVT